MKMEPGKKSYSSLVPSIADILFVSVFLYLSFAAGMGLLADCDTGYHVRTGEYILNSHSIPRHDIFSHLTPPIPWTAHEWLSEVFMALIHRAFGLTGIVIFFAFVIAVTYYLLFKRILADRPNILVAVLVIMLVIGSSQIHWLARPHVFSLLLTVLWYGLLDDFQYNNKNYLYVLPLIMLLWVNLHGGYIISFVLTGIYLAGDLLKFFFSTGQVKSEYRQKVKSLGFAILACLIAALINPYGYHILLFPFKLTANKFIMDNVQEFLSPNFHESMIFTYLLFFMVAIFAISRQNLNIIQLVLILLFSYMSLYSARYIPLFGIIAAPILTRQGDLVLKQYPGRFTAFLGKRAGRIASVDKSARGYIWPVISVLLVVFLVAAGKAEYRFDENIKPVAAVEFLKKEHIKGNMFNNDEFGDYIIYEASPEYKVFFDGRSDMYGEARMKEYFKVIRIEPGWKDVIEKYGITWIIYDAKSVLSRFLLEGKDWKLVYSDKVANIFMKNIPENRKWIEKYNNVKPISGL